MAYSLSLEESVADGIRRIVREEAEFAAKELRNPTGEDRDKAVHEARKSVKKMRAAVRLVEPEMGSAAAKENKRLRDAGRRLSDLRDAAAMIEAIDELAKEGDGEAFAPARAAFVAKKEKAEDAAAIEAAASEMEKVGAHADKWTLDATGFDLVESGLRTCYRAGRKAMRAAEKDLADADFHEWRKRVKDHWYHLRLLAPRLGRSGAAREKRFRELAETLGDEHNLSVIRAAMVDEAAAEPVLERLLARQNELRAKALRSGARLYAEPSRELIERMRSWWDAPVTARPRRKTA